MGGIQHNSHPMCCVGCPACHVCCSACHVSCPTSGGGFRQGLWGTWEGGTIHPVAPLQSDKNYLFNPIRLGGGLNQPALFSDGYFSMKKGVWRSKISWLFLIHYELSENQKKFFWFFTVFWGDLEGAGWFSPPPLSSNIQEPRSIRVNYPAFILIKLIFRMVACQ